MFVIVNVFVFIIGLRGLDGFVVFNLIIELNGLFVGFILILENIYFLLWFKRVRVSVIILEIF